MIYHLTVSAVINTSNNPIQDWINKAFNIKSETSATIIISFSIFILGILINEFIKFVSSYNKRSTVRAMFMLNLKDVNNDILTQSENYKKVADQFVFEYYDNYSITTNNLYKVNILIKIGYEQTFNAFFTGFENVVIRCFAKNKRIVAFNEIWEALEFVNNWQNELCKDFDAFIAIYNKCNAELNKGINDYLEYMMPILFEAQKKGFEFFKIQDYPEDLRLYLIAVDKIQFNWQKTPNRLNPFIIQRKLVLPLLILRKKYPNTALIYGTYKPLLAANYKYIDMRKTLKAYKLMFTNYSETFKCGPIN